MDNEIFDANLLTYAEVFNTIMAPLGDRAPRLRLLTVDYKNRDGVDCCQDITFTQTSDVTDQRLVEIVMEQYAVLGATNTQDGETEHVDHAVSASNNTRN